MFDITKLFSREKGFNLTKEQVAELLHTSPEALKSFEESYRFNVLSDTEIPQNSFDVNSRMAAEMMKSRAYGGCPEELVDRIVRELLSEVILYRYNKGNYKTIKCEPFAGDLVTKEEIESLPVDIRPQLTSTLQKRDIKAESSDSILYNLMMCTNEKLPPELRKHWYHMFRQGLDILDLDAITYEILKCNRNTMGYWLPKIAPAADEEGFFLIPNTSVMKVPMNMLQLTRTDYAALTRATLDIVDRVCYKAFELDESKEYFIKTGTYSSKFDFRNAKVSGEKEVRELGEYLLFIQYQASQMASPLTQPVIYGVSTTNEWVVRDFIEDKENNPCIYKGLPLHTEYRVFVDFDTDRVLGITPYWEPEMMKKRFGDGADRSVHDLHDYAVYRAYEDVLMERYNKNADTVVKHIEALLPAVSLEGQWSIDIMQNENEFWLIDMATAETSAFYEKCVPVELRRPLKENWIPQISKFNYPPLK